MVTLYKKKNFKICGVDGDESSSEYIIINTNKPFQYGHTHVNDYHLAKHIVDMAISYHIPHKDKKFVIESLIRLSTDRFYINKLKSYMSRNKKVSR